MKSTLSPIPHCCATSHSTTATDLCNVLVSCTATRLFTHNHSAITTSIVVRMAGSDCNSHMYTCAFHCGNLYQIVHHHCHLNKYYKRKFLLASRHYIFSNATTRDTPHLPLHCLSWVVRRLCWRSCSEWHTFK